MGMNENHTGHEKSKLALCLWAFPPFDLMYHSDKTRKCPRKQKIHVFQRCLCSHGTIVAAYFPQQAYLYSTASIWQLLYIPGAWLHQQVTQSYRSSWAYLFQPAKCCYWHILCSKPVCSHDATFQLDGYRWCFINVWTWPCRQCMQQNNVLIIDFRKIIA